MNAMDDPHYCEKCAITFYKSMGVAISMRAIDGIEKGRKQDARSIALLKREEDKIKTRIREFVGTLPIDLTSSSQLLDMAEKLYTKLKSMVAAGELNGK
jgi:hypothetical protein